MDRSTARFWFGAMLGVMLIAAEIAGAERKSAGALPSSARSPSGTHRPGRAPSRTTSSGGSHPRGVGPRTRTWPLCRHRRKPSPKCCGMAARTPSTTVPPPRRCAFSPYWCTRRETPGTARLSIAAFDYLLAAQYPNGGWPQYFPLRKGYYSHITYNDDAMVNVLTVLRDAAAGKPPYDFVDAARRARAAAAIARGIDCILRTQIKQNGKLTAWCAQHDETTLKPAWARNFEPPTLSGGESVGIVRFLMEIEQPTPEIIAAIEGAVAWLQAVAIHGVRLEEFTGADGKRDKRVVADPAAGLLWARFYELGTNRPVFTGRDKVIRFAISEIEHERRNGYSYYVTEPRRPSRQRLPPLAQKHENKH